MSFPAVAMAVAIADGSGQAYPDVEHAAVAALAEVQRNPDSVDHEWSGVIYSANDGAIHYTVPVSGRNESAGDLAVKVWHGCTLLAVYHNHPAQRVPNVISNYFSREDVATAKRIGLPFYMFSNLDGRVRLFDPAIDKGTIEWREDGRRGLSLGREVLAR